MAETRLPPPPPQPTSAPPSNAPTFPIFLSSSGATNTTSTPPSLLSHGAEAHLYLTRHLLADPTRLCVLKHRPRKPYRHPTLDARLTRHRILSEARVLAKLRRDYACEVQLADGAPTDEGVDVPALWAADWEAGWLMMEYVRGGTVRERLGAWKAARGGPRRNQSSGTGQRGAGGQSGHGAEAEDDTLNGWAPGYQAGEEVRMLLWRVGRAVGRLHQAGVIHGDLTTGNMLIRDQEAVELEASSALEGSTAATSSGPATASNCTGGTTTVPASLDGPITLIDFGLAAQSVQDEDRAVDLYVLERALGSSHPGLEGWFDPVVMVGYAAGLGGAGKGKRAPGKMQEDVSAQSPQAKAVKKKLDEVRARGRKKSMIG